MDPGLELSILLRSFFRILMDNCEYLNYQNQAEKVEDKGVPFGTNREFRVDRSEGTESDWGRCSDVRLLERWCARAESLGRNLKSLLSVWASNSRFEVFSLTVETYSWLSVWWYIGFMLRISGFCKSETYCRSSDWLIPLSEKDKSTLTYEWLHWRQYIDFLVVEPRSKV